MKFRFFVSGLTQKLLKSLIYRTAIAQRLVEKNAKVLYSLHKSYVCVDSGGACGGLRLRTPGVWAKPSLLRALGDKDFDTHGIEIKWLVIALFQGFKTYI